MEDIEFPVPIYRYDIEHLCQLRCDNCRQNVIGGLEAGVNVLKIEKDKLINRKRVVEKKYYLLLAQMVGVDYTQTSRGLNWIRCRGCHHNLGWQTRGDAGVHYVPASKAIRRLVFGAVQQFLPFEVENHVD